MISSAKILATHRERQAVVYIRQSDPKQVLKNRESGFNQRALRERVIELGWKKHQVVLVDDDQGQSGKEAALAEASRLWWPMSVFARSALLWATRYRGYPVTMPTGNNF